MHFLMIMRADEKHRYIPFMLGNGGMPEHKGWHYLRLGLGNVSLDKGIEEAKAYCGRVFDDAEIVEIWQTDIMGDKIGVTPAWKSEDNIEVPEIK